MQARSRILSRIGLSTIVLCLNLAIASAEISADCFYLLGGPGDAGFQDKTLQKAVTDVDKGDSESAFLFAKCCKSAPKIDLPKYEQFIEFHDVRFQPATKLQSEKRRVKVLSKRHNQSFMSEEDIVKEAEKNLRVKYQEEIEKIEKARILLASRCGPTPEVAYEMWLEKAAVAGLAEAQFQYSKYLREIKKSDAWLKWAKMSAEQGYPEAAGILFAEEHFGEKVKYVEGMSSEEKYKLLARAAENGDELALILLASSGSIYTIDNIEKRIYWLKKLAERGNPTYQLVLGDLYGDEDFEDRSKIKMDLNEGCKWWRLAANQGLLEAKEKIQLNCNALNKVVNIK